MMNYMVWLLALSVFVAGLERLFAARKQAVLREWLWSDALYLLFNGHFLGLFLYGITVYRILPWLDGILAEHGWSALLYRNASANWHLALQLVVALVVVDFVQWCVHNLLHRVSFLWAFHQVHHSVVDGEMDWIVSFRFSWMEPVIYKSITFLPLAWFGFAPEALFFHAVFGTLIGHLNHANLSWDYGPLRYVINSPRMHLYHHDAAGPRTGQNFGIIFSCWDWIFGTAHLPDTPPEHIGFPGVEKVPHDFFGQLAWPLGLLVPRLQGNNVFGSVLGVVVIASLYLMSQPPIAPTPMFGEPAASSQPSVEPGTSDVHHAATPVDGAAAMQQFGDSASAAGWARPDFGLTAKELAEALSAPTLVILDVRTFERFVEGHIPSARLVERGDYSGGEIPGVSFERQTLQEMLRERGVSNGDTLVLMGDGGPEPYRLWWTLTQAGGVPCRVLDGGLGSWKQLGEQLAMGPGVTPERGDITLLGGIADNLMWEDVARLQEQYANLQFVDTRSADQYSGVELNRKAARAGRIPGAKHVAWTDVLYLDGEAPRLRSPEDLRAVLHDADVDLNEPIVTYCQSGTRSSAVYYAALQLGVSEQQLWNYEGSWAEYSRLDLPLQTGSP
ncbi:MAG: 3-mercaptopyruvate sulfurtransferase SseA/sterol desaturase [Myxococcota bacterium]|jgi:3-mercaptopyruvate sulfurtransferase SseA/sterol desaturase/sphingolipid hydroxylase (fatty acid hydroxylase superfamily)